MLGSDACEFGGQLLELLRLAVCARAILADKDGVTTPLEDEVDEVDLAYRAPEKKTLQEIHQLDQDDESLIKYKRALLGPIPVAADPSVANVTLTRMTLLCDQAPGPITMDLTGEQGQPGVPRAGGGGLFCRILPSGEVWGGGTQGSFDIPEGCLERAGAGVTSLPAGAGDLEALKSQPLVLKEGVEYRVKISFKVTKEIVCGLKYVHHTYWRGLKVDRDVYMMGSYGPRAEEYEFLTPPDEAPRGVLVRGTYHIRACFTDDDRTEHLSWEWHLRIQKDWED
ncbi:rho GDP-dissociation inhibitor 3 isoform X1 [Carettochelys insculpta]|uniref:rho GDP-dissociation inhibitor 3 isoform X1 n=1 Tax=Carettochelys insculpta TaxID=44489 RepID=UPI003EBB73A7